jgi:hypothetical protein
MQARESDPLVMLAGSLFAVCMVVAIICGLVAAHCWK